MRVYDFGLITPVDFGELAKALAALADVPVSEVEVADAANPHSRTWLRIVTCGYERAAGDTSWLLEITVDDPAARQPEEDAAAAELADRLGVPILYSAPGVRPSAHWLAAPGARRARARTRDLELTDRPGLWLDAVDAVLPSLPVTVEVMPIPEVIRDHVMDTPLTDAYVAYLDKAPRPAMDDVLGQLFCWESMVMRPADDWPPDGWYPTEFYREGLRARDGLDALSPHELPADVHEQLDVTVRGIDLGFVQHTVAEEPAVLAELLDVTDIARRGWWWHRRPLRPAWHPDQALPHPDLSRTTPT